MLPVEGVEDQSGRKLVGRLPVKQEPLIREDGKPVCLQATGGCHPDHKVGAVQFLDGLNIAHKSHWGPFDREKAMVATIVSVLKPGASNTPSIGQDRWVCEETVNGVTEVALLSEFLKDLLELPEN